MFALPTKNYRLIIIGFIIIIAGFALMVGYSSVDDPVAFDPSIFDFRRITLAPCVVLFGFLFEIYAIMKN